MDNNIKQELTQEDENRIINNAFIFLKTRDIHLNNYGNYYGFDRYHVLSKEKHINYDVCEIYQGSSGLTIVYYKDSSRRSYITNNQKLINIFNETYSRHKNEHTRNEYDSDKQQYETLEETRKWREENEMLNKRLLQSMEENYSDNDEHSDGSVEKAYEQAENVIKEITLDYTIKHDKDKPKLSQVPKEALEAVAEVMAYGTDKYGSGTWNRVEIQRYIDALARHLYAMQDIDKDGREYINLAKKDDESGIEHLYHLLCNAAYAAALYKRNQGSYGREK